MLAKTFAIVTGRRFAVEGHPHSGWRIVDRDTPGARLLEFTFEIQDDGGGNFLLARASLDGVFVADSWHETMDEAKALAAEFGIERTAWKPSPP